MPRPVTGSITEHTAADGTVYRSLRFYAYGKRRRVPLGPVTREEAERRLGHVLADVDRGAWKPAEPAPPPAEPVAEPTFHEYAEQWWVQNERQWKPATVTDYRWRLEAHLLPFFKDHPLGAITVAEVDRYTAAKLAEADAIRKARARAEAKGRKPSGRRPLGASSINKTVILLASILETAVERDLIARNPAAGPRRKVRAQAPRRPYIDGAAQARALLDAAQALDAGRREHDRHLHARIVVSVLMLAGLRIGEATGLRWRDVDLAAGWLRVGEAKTEAGAGRRIRLRPALRDELARVKPADAAPLAFVIPTRTGRRQSKDNLRSRVLAPAIELASRRLADAGEAPLPDGLTPHSLRRTFASILYALDESPAVVMAEMGHTDPGLALRIYAQAMRRDDGEKARLRALVDGAEWANVGQRAPGAAPEAPSVRAA